VHLLLEAGEVPLSKTMQGLQQSYTVNFNRKYSLVGHLFQGRYKAILCDRDAYLLELVRYLHLNPVRSRLVTDPALHPWSSHRHYLGEATEDDRCVETSWVLSQFSRNRAEAVRRYKRFVLDGIGEGHRGDLYQTQEQRYLGGDDFVEQVSRRVEEERPARIGVGLREIEEAVYRQYHLSLELLLSRSKERRGAFGRVVVAYIGQEVGGIKLNEIAKRYGRDQVSLSLGLKRLRERIREEARLRQSLEVLVNRIRKSKIK